MSASYTFYVAHHAKVAKHAVDHCTLLHAGEIAAVQTSTIGWLLSSNMSTSAEKLRMKSRASMRPIFG
ncbi:MAG TPA: hypothetical protein VJ323_06855 [Bryobacteraceae bacterium]|jgi:hypothetical protein|nr:hypothetical protein [Bryobacteraceae bacterium]